MGISRSQIEGCLREERVGLILIDCYVKVKQKNFVISLVIRNVGVVVVWYTPPTMNTCIVISLRST